MTLARILSRTQLGLSAPLVQVELNVGRGLPNFAIVGLPAPVVRESRERVRAALVNCGYQFPAGRITVNLAPVELQKQGGRFDLPIALSLLIASGQLAAPVHPFECYGELGLAGDLRPVSGLFLAALSASRAGHWLIVPQGNGGEVALTGHRCAYGASTLRDAAAQLIHPDPNKSLRVVAPVEEPPYLSEHLSNRSTGGALADIIGQWHAKRALTIAAAGEHSLLIPLSIDPHCRSSHKPRIAGMRSSTGARRRTCCSVGRDNSTDACRPIGRSMGKGNWIGVCHPKRCRYGRGSSTDACRPSSAGQFWLPYRIASSRAPNLSVNVEGAKVDRKIRKGGVLPIFPPDTECAMQTCDGGKMYGMRQIPSRAGTRNSRSDVD